MTFKRDRQVLINEQVNVKRSTLLALNRVRTAAVDLPTITYYVHRNRLAPGMSLIMSYRIYCMLYYYCVD